MPGRPGRLARAQGDYEGARALYKECLGIFRPAGEQPGIAAVLEGLAGIAAAGDQAERAARLFGAAEALRAAIDTPRAPGQRADYDRYVAATHAALGQETFAAPWEAGRAMPLEDALEDALAEEESEDALPPATGRPLSAEAGEPHAGASG